jgi:hypothetical protein
VRPADQGRRKVGGNGHRVSSSALLRFLDSILCGLFDEDLLDGVNGVRHSSIANGSDVKGTF